MIWWWYDDDDHHNQGTDNAASLPHLQRAADGGHLDAIIHVTIIPTFISVLIVLITIVIMIMIIFMVINIMKQYQPYHQKMGAIVIETQQLFFNVYSHCFPPHNHVMNMIVNIIIMMIMTIRLETWLTTCMRTRGGGVICSCSRWPEWWKLLSWFITYWSRWSSYSKWLSWWWWWSQGGASGKYDPLHDLSWKSRMAL